MKGGARIRGWMNVTLLKNPKYAPDIIDTLNKGMVSAIPGSWNLGPLINNYLLLISYLKYLM